VDRILIVGTGVIGTIYGWSLADAGADVTHLVRPGAVPDGDGLRMDVLDERKGHPDNPVTTYRAQIVDEPPAEGPDLVVVPTSTWDASAAIEPLAPRYPDATFLILSSNWEGAAAFDAVLPRERYLLGYPDGGGTIRDGLYWTNLGAEIHLGEVDGSRTEKLEGVVALFERADMTPDVQANILHWLWVHNASTIGFSAGFAKHLDMRATLDDKPLLRRCFDATKELLSLCEARGVNLKDYRDVSYLRWPSGILGVMMRVMYKRNRSMQRYTAHASSPGAMREARLNYDAMLRTAEELDHPMPVLTSLGAYFPDEP
jgi:2-dehydropantoate 2-reductase